MLITDWGDSGHLQPLAISLPSLAYGGAVSWCRATNQDIGLPAVVARHLAGDEEGSLARSLCDIGGLWDRTGQSSVDGSPLSAALLPSEFHLISGTPEAAMVEAVAASLDDAQQTIESARLGAPDASELVLELRAAVRLARHAAERLGGVEPSDVPRLRDDLIEATELQRRAWLARSRPGGLRDSLARLEVTLATYAAP